MASYDREMRINKLILRQHRRALKNARNATLNQNHELNKPAFVTERAERDNGTMASEITQVSHDYRMALKMLGLL